MGGAKVAKRAMIRLEDLGAYDIYTSQDDIIKLQAIADYLKSQGVVFQVNVIPHAFNPSQKLDRSIAYVNDPVMIQFNNMLRYLAAQGGSLNMEGCTHQFSLETIGYEFSSNTCTSNCPPDDPTQACSDWNLFDNSYASGRMRQGFDAFRTSGLPYNGRFITPNYSASLVQRCIIESWAGTLCESLSSEPLRRTVKVFDTDEAFHCGAVYVPTPLGYITGQSDVDRICTDIQSYTGDDLAYFFYHPFVEFQFIQVTSTGVIYNDNSYLKQLIRCFKQQGFQFVRIEDVVHFNPGKRQTGFFPGSQYIFFAGDVNADLKTDFIIWQPATGTWYFAISQFENFLNRQNGGFTNNAALTNWAIGTAWHPLTGDFNGDLQTDIVVWDPASGYWQAALSNGSALIPSKGPGDYNWLKNWAVGNNWVPFTGDFNGDGLDDLLTWDYTTGNWQVALSTGQSFLPQPFWLQSWSAGSNLVPLIGDFNGDGYDDIVVWNPGTGDWQVALSDGTRFIPSGSWLNPWAISRAWTPLVGDFDGDGRSDILVVDVNDGNWQVAQSTGLSFRAASGAFLPWASGTDMQPFTGDFTGKKAASICARHPNLRGGTLDIAVSFFTPLSV